MNGDEELLEYILARVALGDRAAFTRLYNRTAAKLFGVCLRILPSKAEAEEALQESFVKIWRSADQYSGARAQPVSWLAAIARNQAVDILRRQKHAPQLGLEAIADLKDDAPSPETAAAREQDRRHINGCLDELEDNDAKIIRAAYFGGATYETLARHMAMPLGTVKSRIRRSLARLRNCLDKRDITQQWADE